jgi:hypothetical protein
VIVPATPRLLMCLCRGCSGTLQRKPKTSCVPSSRPTTEFHTVRRTLYPASVNTRTAAKCFHTLSQVLVRAFEPSVQLRPGEHDRYGHRRCPFISPSRRPTCKCRVCFGYGDRMVESFGLLQYGWFHCAWREHHLVFRLCVLQEEIVSMIGFQERNISECFWNSMSKSGSDEPK